MKIKGTLVFDGLEGGIWLFDGEDGMRYVLAGPSPKSGDAGRKVEVEGKVDPEAVGLAMTGPIIRMDSYRVL